MQSVLFIFHFLLRFTLPSSLLLLFFSIFAVSYSFPLLSFLPFLLFSNVSFFKYPSFTLSPSLPSIHIHLSLFLFALSPSLPSLHFHLSLFLILPFCLRFFLPNIFIFHLPSSLWPSPSIHFIFHFSRLHSLHVFLLYIIVFHSSPLSPSVLMFHHSCLPSGSQTTRVACVKRKRGNEVPTNFCRNLPRPAEETVRCNLRPCPPT